MRVWATVAIWLAAALPAAATASEIKSAADLPPAVFQLSEAPSRAFLGDAFVSSTLPALKLQAQRVRTRYEIADPSVADALRRGLAAIALIQGHRSPALSSSRPTLLEIS